MVRKALADAFARLEADAGEIVIGSLRRTIGRVVRNLDIPSVTAAAEDELGQILAAWGVEIDERVLPHFQSVFQAGGIAAVVRLTDELGVAVTDTPEISDLVDRGAAAHVATARNRFLQVGSEAWDRLRSTMRAGVEAGVGVDVIARDMRRVVDLTAAQAMMVARTEVISAANAGATHRVDIAQAAGDDVPQFKQWLATLDNRTRDSHVDADGQVVRRDEPFQVGGTSLVHPGDPAGPPEETINCRCAVLFVEDAEGIQDVAGRQAGGVVAGTEDDLAAAAVLSSPLTAGTESTMPFSIRAGGQGCSHEVYNTETGERAPGGCHRTEDDAAAHRDALNAQEDASAAVEESRGSDSNLVADDRGNGHDDGDAGGHPSRGTRRDRRLGRNRPRSDDDPDAEDDDDAHGHSHGHAAVGDAQLDPDELGFDVQAGEHFHAVMHLEGTSTGMRTFLNLSWREPPFAFHNQIHSSAHGGEPEVVQVGLTTRVQRDHFDENVLHGFGHIDLASDEGREFGRRLVGGFARWVSIGLDETPVTVTVEFPEDEDEDEASQHRDDEEEEDDGPPKMVMRPPNVTIDGGRIGELTAVSVPAQDDAVIEATQELIDALAAAGDSDVVTASGVDPDVDTGDHSDGHFADIGDAQGEFDDTRWDAGTAMSRCSDAQQPGACFRGIAAGRRRGDPDRQSSWALPHHKTPASPPNATGVRAALGALSGARGRPVQGLINREQAQSHLDRHQAVITRERERRREQDVAADDVADMVEALTASAYVIKVPDLAPAWWFEAPLDVEIPGGLCVTDEGRIYGILTPLGTGHRAGVRGGGRSRIEAPHGNVDYDRFLSKEALVSGPDGEPSRVHNVGCVTMDCGHASRFRPNHHVATEHYDNACSVVGKIRCGEMGNVVWAAGALEPGVTPAQLSRMLACDISGDWQPHPDRPGWSELVAALLVPSGGFPTKRSAPTVTTRQGVLVASSVPVLHREPRYIESVDRDPVLALGLNDIAGEAVRRSYLRRLAAAEQHEDMIAEEEAR